MVSRGFDKICIDSIVQFSSQINQDKVSGILLVIYVDTFPEIQSETRSMIYPEILLEIHSPILSEILPARMFREISPKFALGNYSKKFSREYSRIFPRYFLSYYSTNFFYVLTLGDLSKIST